MTSEPVPSVASVRKRSRKRRGPGWIPDHHGAWAMLTVPLVLGIAMGGFRWIHVPLTVTWYLGYFAFFAMGLWLKSRRRPKYWPPVRAYCLAAVPFGLAVWIPAFAPLLVASLAYSYDRNDRALANDALTVIAGCLMLPVAYYPWALAGPGWGWPAVLVAFALVLAYFLGTVFYVKTMIRERGSALYLRMSIAFHLATILLPSVLALTVPAARLGSWGVGAFTIFFTLAAVRATLMPKRGATPKQVGIGEIVASVVLTVLVLVFL